ncbi:MAG: hypothetical protein IT563_24920 [Alphaproteobacteria bacterium]|nr:hypothetical protein [Alphaproteobacteria bacterium]
MVLSAECWGPAARLDQTAGQYSNFQFATTPENIVASIAETSDSATVYPAAGAQTASYNNLNQLTNLSGQALTYDANGNLLSDGQRNYSWDAESRLVKITYPGQAGKQTDFVYDGLDRRTKITSTSTEGGSSVTMTYAWCGSRICQARNASNAVARSYFSEGEFVPGSPAQPYYYGQDQLGSIRRAFVNTSSAPAYSYDLYGVTVSGTTPSTDFGYAGMFFSSDSGLYLTRYRAYDSIGGRWLSRDPLGERGRPSGQPLRLCWRKAARTEGSDWTKPNCTGALCHCGLRCRCGRNDAKHGCRR